jgi:retron-type reverse transcriptase
MKRKENQQEQALFSNEEMGLISLEDVFEAYFECRKNKRNTCNAIKFEMNYEDQCYDLWQKINNGTYKPGRSLVFIADKPVKREIFAADFRDRVVHHLIAKKILPLLEDEFIEDSYATRIGRGTLYGIDRVGNMINECSEGYTKNCYIMKLDIQSFFMNIRKQRLFDMIDKFLRMRYHENDLELLMRLLKLVIFNNPIEHCVVRSPRKKWNDLPRNKSLFGTDGSYGLPIGNLTSQLLALFYLNGLDHKVKEEWGIKYYGRYVDDMVLIDESVEKLMEVKTKIQIWLERMELTLHPKKMYLQHYSKGVLFIGGMIKPGRKYVSNRSLGFCCDTILRFNKLAVGDKKFVSENAKHFVAVINSYLGMIQHFNSYCVRRKIWHMIGNEWYRVMYFENYISKAVLFKKYRKFDKSMCNNKVT